MRNAYRGLFIVCMAGMLVAPLAASSEETLSVEVNKGKRVTLPKAAASVVAANPAIADVQVVSPRVLYIYGKDVGETSVFAVDSEDNTIYDAQIIVGHNLSTLNAAVKKLAPNADVQFKSVNGGLVMEGFASSNEESEQISSLASNMVSTANKNQKLVNMITTGGSDQVTLQVKIVEMSRNDLKVLGINLSSIQARGDSAFQLLQGNDILFNTSTPGTLAYRAPGNPLSRANSNTNILLRYNSLIGVLDALETQGLASTLAEPTLTTTSGKTANFLAGGQYPLPIVQSSSGSAPTVTIQYQPFGVSLNFTPTVLSKERMSIAVAPEVSTLDFNNPISVSGVTYPILNTRRAQATVELGSGETFMLAGLLKNDLTNNINKLPGVGDLPVLGALFRSQQFQNNKTELVILVTPYIVRPVAEGKKMLTPQDGYVPPTDLQRLLLGNLYQQEPMGDEESSEAAPVELIPNDDKSPKLKGGGGFILE